MTKIARTIAMDGEGATKLIEVQVTGAESKDDARKVVKTIINSPLVKTAIFGADPNYGRLMMAVGNSGCKFDLNEVRLTIKGGDMEVPILDSGAPIFQDERAVEVVRMAMDNKEVTIMVDGGGHGRSIRSQVRRQRDPWQGRHDAPVQGDRGAHPRR